MKPDSRWYKNIDPDKKEAWTSALVSSEPLRRLQQLLKTEFEGLHKRLLSEDFDSPSWAYKQAYLNGRLSELTRQLDLLEFIS